MKSVRKKNGISLLTIGVGLTGILSITASQVNSNRPRISEPDLIAISANAESVRQVRPGEPLHYVITGKDVDQPVGNGNPAIDPEFSIRPVVLRSFAPGTARFVKREIAPNGTVTYDVSGRASSAPGSYFDTFVAYDHRAGNDPRKDNPIDFTQTVIITGNAQRQGTTPFVPSPKASADRPATSRDHTSRERYSNTLRAQITRFLRRRSRGVTRSNGSTVVPVSAMPVALQQTANDYIRRIRSGPIQNAISTSEAQGTYQIVLLPAPSTALGVDVQSGSGGMLHY